MTDLISRAEAIEYIDRIINSGLGRNKSLDYIHKYISALPSAEAEPKENHTQATGAKHVIKSLGKDSIPHDVIDCTEFIRWLIEEVMDDEMWELNAVGNGEIICRKLKKLGLLEVKDGYYIRPSAEAVQGWIPCSDRLPEKDELVLVTVWGGVSIAWRNIYGGWESAEDMYEKDVTAWMPLPKPYREDDEV